MGVVEIVVGEVLELVAACLCSSGGQFPDDSLHAVVLLVGEAVRDLPGVRQAVLFEHSVEEERELVVAGLVLGLDCQRGQEQEQQQQQGRWLQH